MEINVPRQSNHAYSLTAIFKPLEYATECHNYQPHPPIHARLSCWNVLLTTCISNQESMIKYEYHYTTSCFHHTTTLNTSMNGINLSSHTHTQIMNKIDM